MPKFNRGDIHDRHDEPRDGEEFDTNPEAKPQRSAKEAQAIRDAHFKENGVKADGTVPKQEESESDES